MANQVDTAYALKFLETVYRSSRGDYSGYKCETIPRVGTARLLPRFVFVKTNNPEISTGHSLVHETHVHRAMGGAPGVVPLVTAWVAQEQPSRSYIMTEYSAHGDLDSLIKRHGRLSEKDARLIIWQLLQGLEAIHRRGYVHLDIKPANWLIRVNLLRGLFGGIIDFGMSQEIRAIAGKFAAQRWGTPGFTAPEIDNHLLLALPDRADIYSAGCFLFYTLTGKHAYDPAQAAHFRLHSSNEINGVCSPPALDFLWSLLHQDPMARPSATQALMHPWFGLLLEEQDILAMSYPPAPCPMVAVMPPNTADAPPIVPAAEPAVAMAEGMKEEDTGTTESAAAFLSEAPEAPGEIVGPAVWAERVHRAITAAHDAVMASGDDEGFVDEPEPTLPTKNDRVKRRRKAGPRRELYRNQIRYRVEVAKMRRQKQSELKAIAEELRTAMDGPED